MEHPSHCSWGSLVSSGRQLMVKGKHVKTMVNSCENSINDTSYRQTNNLGSLGNHVLERGSCPISEDCQWGVQLKRCGDTVDQSSKVEFLLEAFNYFKMHSSINLGIDANQFWCNSKRTAFKRGRRLSRAADLSSFFHVISATQWHRGQDQNIVTWKSWKSWNDHIEE